MRRSIGGVIATATALAWLYFVWPTPYRYLPSGAMRVNRFNESGRASDAGGLGRRVAGEPVR